MRTISKKTQYSLRALYALARSYGQGPVLISKLAQQENIPLQFLEQILLGLRREGLVESRKGKGGGYLLSQSPEEVTIGNVIRLMEGPLAPLPCASERAFRKCDECTDIRFCGTRFVMRQVRDATANILDQVTLAAVVRQIDEAKAAAGTDEDDPLMYHI